MSATARRSRWAHAEGLIKTVFDARTGELLGAHMIGAEVTELIQGYTIARTLETTEARAHADGLPASDPVRDDAGGRSPNAYGKVVRV
jgi:pyruvate/2-oxoglutarate dehydrogenase complex dihydrolipoamide dehydrogenase (E3) component